MSMERRIVKLDQPTSCERVRRAGRCVTALGLTATIMFGMPPSSYANNGENDSEPYTSRSVAAIGDGVSFSANISSRRAVDTDRADAGDVNTKKDSIAGSTFGGESRDDSPQRRSVASLPDVIVSQSPSSPEASSHQQTEDGPESADVVAPPQSKPKVDSSAEQAPVDESRMEVELSRPDSLPPEAEKIIAKMSYLSPAKKKFYRDFLLDLAHARARYPDMAKKTNPDIMIAQGIMESGWGQSGLTKNFNAYFGIKVGDWKGAVAEGQPTAEYDENGSRYHIKDGFRAYEDMQESIVDYMHLITSLSRYGGAVNNANNPVLYAKGLKDGGYATSPSYHYDLARLADQQQAGKLYELTWQHYNRHNQR